MKWGEGMINQDELKIMTKLAIMDKNKSSDEKKAETHFRKDFVYINNLKTRIYVTIVYIIIIGAYYFNLIYVQNQNPLAYDIASLVTKLVVIYGVVLFVFSMLSTAIYRKRYKIAEDKNNQYRELLAELKEMRKEG